MCTIQENIVSGNVVAVVVYTLRTQVGKLIPRPTSYGYSSFNQKQKDVIYENKHLFHESYIC